MQEQCIPHFFCLTVTIETDARYHHLREFETAGDLGPLTSHVQAQIEDTVEAMRASRQQGCLAAASMPLQRQQRLNPTKNAPDNAFGITRSRNNDGYTLQHRLAAIPVGLGSAISVG